MPTNMIETNAHESAQGVNVGKLPEPNVPGDPNRMTMWTRRKFLVGAGAVGTAVISGCAVPGVAIPTAVRMATATPTITPAKIDPEKARATPTPPVLPTAAPTAVPTVAPTPTKASTSSNLTEDGHNLVKVDALTFNNFKMGLDINVDEKTQKILLDTFKTTGFEIRRPEVIARKVLTAMYFTYCWQSGKEPNIADFTEFSKKIDQNRQTIKVPGFAGTSFTGAITVHEIPLNQIKQLQIQVLDSVAGNISHPLIGGNNFAYGWDAESGTLILYSRLIGEFYNNAVLRRSSAGTVFPEDVDKLIKAFYFGLQTLDAPLIAMAFAADLYTRTRNGSGYARIVAADNNADNIALHPIYRNNRLYFGYSGGACMGLSTEGIQMPAGYQGCSSKEIFNYDMLYAYFRAKEELIAK